MLEGDGARRPQRRHHDVLAPLAPAVPVAREGAARPVRQAVRAVRDRRRPEQAAVPHGVDDAVPVGRPRPPPRRVEDRLLDGRRLLRDEGLGVPLERLASFEQPAVDRRVEDVDGDVESRHAHRVLLQVESNVVVVAAAAAGTAQDPPSLPHAFV